MFNLEKAEQITFSSKLFRMIGLNRTNARLLIVEILRFSQKSLSFEDIQRISRIRLKKIHRATIYRILWDLISAQIVKKVSKDLYKIADGFEATHLKHNFCPKCHECASCSLKSANLI